MSKRGIIQPESPKKCEFCGAVKECRPYGPNNEQICYECGQKDIETTKKKMAEYLGFGDNTPLRISLEEEKEDEA